MAVTPEIDKINGVNSASEGTLCTDTDHEDTGVELDIKEATVPPDGGWGWFVMIGCLLSHLTIGLRIRSSGVFYLQVRSYYGQSAEMSSWAVSISVTLYMLLAPLASALCNRFMIRTVVALGATLSSVGVLLAAFSPDIYLFSSGFGLLLGFGLAFAHGPSLIILGQYFDKRRSLTAAIASAGAPVSFFLFSTTLEELFIDYGFTGAFIILTAFVGNFYICAALYRPLELNQRFLQLDRRKQMKNELSHILQSRTRYDSDQPVQSSGTVCSYNCAKAKDPSSKSDCYMSNCNGKAKRQILLELSQLNNFAFLCLCVQLFLFPLSFLTMVTYFQALALERNITAMQGADLLSGMCVCDALSRLVVSIFLDMERIRPHRLVIYNVSIFAIALATGAVPFMTTVWQFGVVSCVYGLSLGLYLAQKSVVCVDVLGVEHLTNAFGILLAFEGVGTVASPIIGGLMEDYFGRYDVVFYVGSVGMFVGGGVMVAGNMWLYRRKRMQGV